MQFVQYITHNIQYIIYNIQQMRQAQTKPIGTTQIENRHIKLKNQISNKGRYSKYSYHRPIEQQNYTRNKTQIYNPNQEAREQLRKSGLQVLRKDPIAVILFAGGYGARAQLNESKQFKQIRWQEASTSLFEISINSIKDRLTQKQNIIFYIICSRLNSEKVITEIQQLSITHHELPLYIAYQTQQNVLDFNGSQNVFSGPNKNLTYPGGMGAFKNAIIHYDTEQRYTLAQHITKIIKPKYVYCIGTSNCLEQGIDVEMLGLIEQKQLDCVFKCNYLKYTNKQLHVACLREHVGNQPAWLVMQYKNLYNLCPDEGKINAFPIWMDNFVFSTYTISEQNKLYERLSQNQSLLKYQFINRNLRNKRGQEFNCIIAQKTISYTVMKNRQKCLGYIPNSRIQQQHHFLKTKDDFIRLQSALKSKSPSKLSKLSKTLKRKPGMSGMSGMAGV